MMSWENWQDVLGVTGLVSMLSYLILLIFKFQLASIRLGQSEVPTEHRLDITVMQPLLSGDPQLESMLEFNLKNTKESVQFQWLIDQNDRVAIQIAQKLSGRYSGRICTLLCEPASPRWNPKSFKLALGLAHVQSEYVAVLDDDTSIPNSNLERAISLLKHADLYTGLPLFHSSPGIGSQLVTHFVNNNSLMTYLASAQIIPPITINGMFYVSRTTYMRSLNAFELIGQQLCDDLALARAVLSAGGIIHQGSTPLELRMTVNGLRHYFLVMHRWFVFADILISQQTLKNKLLLGLLLGVPAILLWSSLLVLFLGPISLAALSMFMLLRFGILRKLILQTKTQDIPLNFLWSVLSELCQPIHYMHAALCRRIVWRNHHIKVHRNGTFEYLESISVKSP